MVLGKNLALSGIAAVIIGLVVILSPAFLFSTQVERIEYSALESPVPGAEMGSRDSPQKAEPSLSGKTYPAYTLDIAFPSKDGYVSLRRSGSVKLLVTVQSWVNEPVTVDLRLVSFSGEPLPEFITFEAERPIILQPYEDVQTYIMINVSDYGNLGEYFIAITGDLMHPIEGYNEIVIGFTLEVI